MKTPLKVTAKAPTRIDLAGGTLDLWPLPCFFPGAMTLNAAIDLYAEVTIEKRTDRKISILSQDTGKSQTASNIHKLKPKKGLELIQEIIRFYAPHCGFNLTTHCAAPLGSGIAGSSALNIALNGALNAFTGSPYPRKDLISIAKNLEATVIGVPTGVQDYYPALYGGAYALHFHPRGVKRECLNSYFRNWQAHSILCYTGTSRFSGTNNWEILKKTIDGNHLTREGLHNIQQAAMSLYQAILNEDRKEIAEALGREWASRKRLAKGVSHPGIEKLIGVAEKRGTVTAKVCGAGGGGCLYFYILEGNREEIEEALEKAGGKVIKFNFVKNGMWISVQ